MDETSLTPTVEQPGTALIPADATPSAGPPKDLTPPQQLPLAALSPRQVVFLLQVAETPLEPTEAILERCAQLHPKHAVVQARIWKWRMWAGFRQLHDAIRRDPQVAANFLLAWSQPAAMKALRSALESGGHRVASDAARILMLERREQGAGDSRKRIADLIARALSG